MMVATMHARLDELRASMPASPAISPGSEDSARLLEVERESWKALDPGD